jgi:hypothetical protein
VTRRYERPPGGKEAGMTETDPQERVQAEIREDAERSEPDPLTRREALENECRTEGEPPGGHQIGEPID